MEGEALQCDTKLRNDRENLRTETGVQMIFNSLLDKTAAILTGDNFKCIFLNENDTIPIRISLKFVTRCRIDNKPAFVQVMAWRRTGDKPLPELMLIPVHWCIYAVNLLSIYNPGLDKHSHAMCIDISIQGSICTYICTHIWYLTAIYRDTVWPGYRLTWDRLISTRYQVL